MSGSSIIESSQESSENRDKPIPVSERYRKSFIATFTWSSLATLIAWGSIGESSVKLPLTQMSYQTPLIVIFAFGFSLLWFLQFVRSERILKIASSEFAFGLSAASLAEALEGFTEKVKIKSAEIGSMQGVAQPDFSDGRMALMEAGGLLDALSSNLQNSPFGEWSSNLLYALENGNKGLEERSSENLKYTIQNLREILGTSNEKIKNSYLKIMQLEGVFVSQQNAIIEAGSAALQKVEGELSDVKNVANQLTQISSKISEEERRDQRNLEYIPARIMITFAAISSAVNLIYEFI